MKPTVAVTGAFGYLGRHITAILAGRGQQVLTLTGHPGRPNPFGAAVEAVPFAFDRPGRMVEALRGVDLLFNTYWVRFNHGDTSYAGAVANTQNLVRAATEAGVRRIVHTSITNPAADSPFEYFRGKAVIEDTIRRSGLSYAILRPTVFFGGDDVLINNIAWMLRRLPVFGLFGHGRYRMQPVSVTDAAGLAVRLAEEKEDLIVDAVGPETYAYGDLVRMVRSAVGSRALLAPIPGAAALAAGWVLGRVVGDVVITRAEIGGLSADLLVSNDPPTCPTRFSDWLAANADGLGRQWASELGRHF